MKFKIRKIGRILNFEDQKYKSKVIEKIQTNFQEKKIKTDNFYDIQLHDSQK